MLNNQATAKYSFDVQSSGAGQRIVYKKSMYGPRLYFSLLWPSFIAAAFLGYWSRPRYESVANAFSAGLFYCVLYTFIIPAVVVIILNLLRRPGTIVVNPGTIEINGVQYQRNDIHALYVKSPAGRQLGTIERTSSRWGIIGGDRVEQIGYGAATAVAGAVSGVASAASQLSHESGKAIARNFQAQRYKICILFGEREVAVASELNEKSAFVLMNQLTSLL